MIHDPLKKFFTNADPTREWSDADIDVMFPPDRLLDRIEHAREVSAITQTPRKLWRRTTIIASASILVLAGTAAAISFLRAPVRDVSRVSCFERDSLTSTVAVVPYSTDPLAVCGSLLHWPAVPGSSSAGGSLCVLQNGSIAGFPSSRKAKVCETLGLETFSHHLKSPGVARFEHSVQAVFIEHTCITLPTAKREVLRLIDKYGLTTWTVKTIGSPSQDTCATLAIEIPSMTVRLIGIAKIGQYSP